MSQLHRHLSANLSPWNISLKVGRDVNSLRAQLCEERQRYATVHAVLLPRHWKIVPQLRGAEVRRAPPVSDAEHASLLLNLR